MICQIILNYFLIIVDLIIFTFRPSSRRVKLTVTLIKSLFSSILTIWSVKQAGNRSK